MLYEQKLCWKNRSVRCCVSEAFAEIVGTKEKVFKSESKLQLVCALRQATAKPDYIFW